MVLAVYLDPWETNSRKVLAGLELIGASYEVHRIDYLKGEQKSDEFKRINPMSTIPVAIEDDLYLSESNAILLYAADTEEENPAYPKDLKARASVHRWMLWESSAWFGSCYVFVLENVMKPRIGAEPAQEIIDANTPNWKKLAGILNDQLGKTKFLTGESVTIADIAVAAPLQVWKASHTPLQEFPHLHRWYTQDIKGLPAWKKTQEAVNKVLGNDLD